MVDMDEFKDNQITGKIKLILDKDFDKLLCMSEKTGVPLTFRGDRIIDFKVNGVPDYDGNIKPDQIKIGPPAFIFDLKLGDNEFSNVPFDRLRISDDTVVFKSLFYSELDVNLKIRFKLDDEKLEAKLNITISPKSNKIRDILNYELSKREFSNNKFQLIPFGNINSKIEGDFPSIEFDDQELEFYKKVDYINTELNLDMSLEDDYIINNADFECVDMICDFINYKKIKLNNITLSMKTPIDGLYEFIAQNRRQMVLKQDDYVIKLLGNDIHLGPCKLEIKQYEILNLDDLKELYEKNRGNTDLISVSAILKDYANEELFMDFNI